MRTKSDWNQTKQEKIEGWSWQEEDSGVRTSRKRWRTEKDNEPKAWRWPRQ